jgi:hypothetical protein
MQIAKERIWKQVQFTFPVTLCSRAADMEHYVALTESV